MRCHINEKRLGLSVPNLYVKNIVVFALFITFSLSIAIIYHSFLDSLGFGYPWNTFLFDPSDRFNDWFNTVRQAQSRNPYYAEGPALATYFPFSYVLFDVLGRNGFLGVIVYFFVTCLLSITLCLSMNQSDYWIEKVPDVKLRFKLICSLVGVSLLTYPAIFSFDRGNIDFWISLLCSIFIFLRNSKIYYFGLIALAVAVSLKGYPAAFLLLLIMEGKYRNVIIVVSLAMFLTICPLILMWDSPSSNFQGFLTNFKKYTEVYVIGNGSLFASSDPYNALRLGAFKLLQIFDKLDAEHVKKMSLYIYSFYKYFIFLFAALVSLYVLLIRDCQWKKVLAICLLTILFPSVANDYKLSMLLPAIYLLVLHDLTESKSRNMFFMICLLLIPKSYLFFSGKSISMIINPIILGYLSFLILRDKTVALQLKNYVVFFFKRRV